MKKLLNKQSSGFTLIEILVVIGIIAVLAAIVIIAINPARQFAQARDTARHSDLNAILNAIGQKTADCKGKFDASTTDCPTTAASACSALPTSLATKKTIIKSGTAGSSEIKLDCLTPTYISELPVDPSLDSSSTSTGYEVYQEGSGGRIHLLADTDEPNIPRTDAIEIVR